MKKLLNIALPILLIAAVFFVGNKAWNLYMNTPWTRDGRVQVEIVQVTPEVNGKVKRLYITDNQEVNKGDLLLEIDQTDYVLALEKAKLNAESLEIQLETAKDTYERDLKTKEFVSAKQLIDDKFNVKQLNASLKQAKVEINNAEVDLKRTKIYAIEDGYITNLNLRQGNYVSVGKPLFALVEEKTFYLTGYFTETSVGHIEIGQKAKASLMINDQTVNLRVSGIGRAIVDQSADNSGLVSNVNPTVPWVRLSQRIPVRFEIVDDISTLRLASGSTATISIEE
ncbi:HlyD family secretion protein [Vibrio sp. SS-MA-C1-2]|uniref:HlyD family secretion protein n=1 Tax=Vibrio sp. SS-MA-C1-2 TaxID=2908646 RepID=UPI001F180577|nr:HlyD family secretion protein [Vibrio sp. SS-MA-C1-2]UJF18722.1 HlyD family secretion protein [Vibrio sp. SS-MA-C1-2]